MSESIKHIDGIQQQCASSNNPIEIARLNSQLLGEIAKSLQDPKYGKEQSHYNVKRFDLTTARTDEQVDIPGDNITTFTNGSVEGCSVKLDKKTNDSIFLSELNKYRFATGFKRFFLTTTAQSGKYLRLHIGGEAFAEPQTQEITSNQKYYVATSKKQENFTTGLPQYAYENEGLTAVVSISRIVGVNFKADQLLHYRLYFHRDGNYFNPTGDVNGQWALDDVIGWVDIDLPTHGAQVGTVSDSGARKGIYYLNLQNLNIDYRDDSGSRNLRLSLQNLSPTAKNPYSDAFVNGAVLDDGGSYTNYTTQARETTANDVVLLPAVPAINDAFMLGAYGQFGSAALNIGTAGVGNWTITWYYWNGTAWTALSGVVDNTDGFRNSGSNTVTFTWPTDWVPSLYTNITAYWIRGQVTAFTSIATQPLGTDLRVTGQGVFLEVYYEPRQFL